MITEKQFKTAAKAIIDQVNTDHKISEALKAFCPQSYAFYETTMLTSMLELLAASAGDEDRWFDYWLFELAQGKKHKRGTVKIDGKCVRLKTLDDVWNIIKKQENKK